MSSSPYVSTYFFRDREWVRYVDETSDVGVHHDFDVIFGDFSNFIHTLDETTVRHYHRLFEGGGDTHC